MNRVVYIVLLSIIIFSSFSIAKKKLKGWRKDYPVVVYSVLSGENERDRIIRMKPVTDYLTKELGVEVKLFTATDYAGTIEAMKAGKAHFASYGTASYAAAWDAMKGNVEPLLTQTDETGGSGYHSTIWVRKDSNIESLDDLKGKTLAFADPNSTSGFLVPSYYLRKFGYDYDTYFSKTGFSGSHENGILAVVKGTYNAACTWFTNEERNNPLRMSRKGMIDIDEIKMIWKSPIITNGPIAAIKSLPQEMKDDFKNAMLAFPKKNPEGWKAYFHPDPPRPGYIEVNHARYVDFIEMREQNLLARKN